MLSFISRLMLLLACCCWLGSAQAQRADSAAARPAAPASPRPPGFMAKMQAFAKKAAVSSAADFKSDKVRINQDRTFERIKGTMQKAGFYLKNGIDTSGIKTETREIDQDFAVAGDGVFTHKGTEQTFRNLTATSVIIGELYTTALARKAHLDRYQRALATYKYQLDSLLSVNDLFAFPADSVGLVKYIQLLRAVNYEIHPIDSALTKATDNVRTLVNQTNVQVSRLQTALEEIELYRREMATDTYERDFPDLWEPAGNTRPFGQILHQAWDKGCLTLLFYAQNSWGKITLFFLLTAVAWLYVRSLKSIYVASELLQHDFSNQLVLKYPLLSALLITCSIVQFVFVAPPFLFSVLFWLVACATLTFVFRGFITRYWMRVWLVMVFFFLLGTADNLLLQASRNERWYMLAVSVGGFFTGVGVLLNDRKKELREQWIVFSIGLMAVAEAGATLANLLGRYNLGKALLIAGFLNVIVAILFLWTIRIIDEGLYLAFNVYTEQDRKLFFLNFQRVGQKSPLLLTLLLVVGWTILVGRNFPAFAYIATPLKQLLTQDRTVGNYTFTILSLALFVFILMMSVIVSKVVSFFASDKAAEKSGTAVQRLGSWLLLVRISILVLGLLLAFSAAGIPLNEIAIILGALGVGIGFGLQTLVNNLVSGLIIAFEKPVNVGDVVDVDGQGGKVKSIGFRSSIIATWDGADVVMPNGDLLNSHLTNWSMGGNQRRQTLVMGVAYGTDLALAKELITNTLDAHERVFKHPAPVILFEQFNNSAIDIRVYFWTRLLMEGYVTKSGVLAAINDAFNQHGVVIAFPQQDVHFYPADPRTKNELTSQPTNETLNHAKD